MDIIKAAEEIDVITANQKIVCPICHEKQFSPFDKVYVTVYEKCVMCTADDDELELNAGNIFTIM